MIILVSTNNNTIYWIAKHVLLRLLIVLLLIGTCTQVRAFEKDTHYLLTFGLALATCFD
ncbi:hypothetical protein ACFL17_03110 [Pseudomonadota bacterium]